MVTTETLEGGVHYDPPVEFGSAILAQKVTDGCNLLNISELNMERAMGIEPTSEVWGDPIL